MTQPKLYLFGPPRLERAGKPVEINLRKALALLAYLAITGQPHSRDALATLLWPDSSQRTARANLRRTLYELKEATKSDLIAGAEMLELDQDATLWVDVRAFHDLTTCLRDSEPDPACETRLEQAAALYAGDFLAGFTLPDSVEWDEWQFFERESLRQTLAQLLERLVTAHEARGAWESAIPHARRWLALDPLHEPAHRALMRLYARSGQHAAALRQFEECRRILDEELGAPPEEETNTLYEAVRARQLAPMHEEIADLPRTPSIVIPASDRSTVPTNLPVPATPFVGRAESVRDILRRLDEPACRLLTLIGPGGIGKSRLAIEVARHIAEEPAHHAQTPHGIFWVPLAAVEEADGIVAAIAEALSQRFYGAESPRAQLFDYLRERKVLLVLDNFEQLLGESPFVTELLQAAPGARLLVTSREALNLQEEWFHPVLGLRVPRAESARDYSEAELDAYDAVQLFVQAARRAQPSFTLDGCQDTVGRICRLVEGMPLALELAAAWLKVIPVEQVAAEIERGLDILTTRLRNIPERHRSMRAVLEQSWQMLQGDEGRVLEQLSLFRGGFDQTAAREVAGASLSTLASLVDKSLVQVEAGGRYRLHELLRQFAAEQLAEQPLVQREAQHRHSEYYLSFAAFQERRLTGKEQSQSLNDIEWDIENVRSAWQRAVAQQQWDAIEPAIVALYYYFHIRSRYAEGESLFSHAAERLARDEAGNNEKVQRTLCRLGARRGALLFLLGRYAEALSLLHEALDACAQERERAFILQSLGLVEYRYGNIPQAETFLRQAEALSRKLAEPNAITEALHARADLTNSLGRYAEGRDLALACLEINRELQRPDIQAESMLSLAWSYCSLGEYTLSEATYREALAFAETIGARNAIAVSLHFLGWIRYCLGEPHLQESLAFYEQARAIYPEIGHRGNLAMCLGDMSLSSSELHDYQEATRYGSEGLQVSREVGNMDIFAYNLICLALASAGSGEFDSALSQVGDALKLSWEKSILPQTLFALYGLGTILHKRMMAGGTSDSTDARLAVGIATRVVDHPATWHPVRERAARLRDDLLASLPPDIVARVEAESHSQSFEATISALVNPSEAARPIQL